MNLHWNAWFPASVFRVFYVSTTICVRSETTDQNRCAEDGSGYQYVCASESAERTEQPRAWDIMQCRVVTVDRKDPVQKAVMLRIERDISGLPVAHEGRLDGMLSEKDLLQLFYETQYLPGLVAGLYE